MILEIFLPEKFGKTRILSQRIISFTIQEHSVTATKVYVTRSKTMVQKLLQEPIEVGDQETVPQRTAGAIRKILETSGKYDQIRIAIPASITVFRELTVPFIDNDKIRMVVEYEVESLLPFELDDAIIDFIVIEQNKEKNESQILVAAVQIIELEKTLAIYRLAGVEPTSITVDLLALYGLYQQIPLYQKINKGSALIDMSSRSTRVAFLVHGKLRLIRNISKGITTIAEQVSKDTGMTVEQVLETIYSFGIQKTTNDAYNKSLEKHLMNLLNDIQFTLNSFSLKLNFYDNINKLIFSGLGPQISHLMEFSSTTLQIPAESFDTAKIFDNPEIKDKIAPRAQAFQPFTFAIATALPHENQIDFNLRRKTLKLIQHNLLQKQIIVACALLFFSLAAVGSQGFFRLNNLTKITKKTEQHQLKQLKKVFTPGSKSLKKTRLRTLLKDAERVVDDKEEMWAPFAQQRLRPLVILQELSRMIDKRRYNVSIDELTIATDEDGLARIEITGFFQSKTGIDHFRHFGIFQKTFEVSRTLELTEEIDPTPADKGVKFIAKLKQKETSQ